MYQRILVAVEHSAADQTILAHVQPLARLTQARLLLLHVADGWAARAYDELQLRESEEMRDDREYLEGLAAGLRTAGFEAEWRCCSCARGARERRRSAARQAQTDSTPSTSRLTSSLVV